MRDAAARSGPGAVREQAARGSDGRVKIAAGRLQTLPREMAKVAIVVEYKAPPAAGGRAARDHHRLVDACTDEPRPRREQHRPVLIVIPCFQPDDAPSRHVANLRAAPFGGWQVGAHVCKAGDQFLRRWVWGVWCWVWRRSACPRVVLPSYAVLKSDVAAAKAHGNVCSAGDRNPGACRQGVAFGLAVNQ